MRFSVSNAICLLGVLGLVSASNSIAKSYSIDQVKIHAELFADGRLKIEEARTYKFRGRFSWADYRLPLDKVGTVEDFVLMEGERLFESAESKEPGTYEIQASDAELYVKWYYKARNETRTFTLSYTIRDVATVYDDIAEFYFKFIGEANRKQIRNVRITIMLPQPADTTRVKAWAHGPLWGEIQFEAGDLKMFVSPLPPETFWEARVLLPRDWLPAARNRKPKQVRQAIVAEEEELARRANEERERAAVRLRQKKENEKKAWPIAIALVGVAFLAWGRTYSKYGRGFDVPYRNKIDSAIPDDLSPTLASYLYYQKQVYGAALMTTLLNLARRGYLKIEQHPPEGYAKKKKSRKNTFTLTLENPQWRQSTDLMDFEKELLTFVFDDLGNRRESFDFSEFKKNRKKVRKWFPKWEKLVKGHYEGRPYWDKASIKGTIIASVVSVCIVALGVLVIVIWGTPGILAIVGGAVCLGLSFTILRYTPEVKLLRKKLEALRTYIKKYHFTSGDRQNFLNQIQEYMVYAIALGVGSRAVEKLLGMIPDEEQRVYFPWYVAYSGTGSTSDFAHAMTSFVSIATTTMSSATGTGGGASVGGGGGAGGAAGGAG